MSIRTAFILGAGLGTRLRPLTESRPKLLVPILGQPLLFYTLDYLLNYGLNRFVINTHHLAHTFDRYFGGHDGEFSYRGASIRLVYETTLLETAGGIRNARKWIGEDPFLVVNGDILTDIPLTRLLRAPETDTAPVILGLRPGPPQVGMDEKTGSVMDFHHKLGKTGLSYFLFASLYILRPEIYHWIPADGPVPMMSIFWKLLKEGRRIGGKILEPGFWNEIGNPASYLEVHRQLIHQFPARQRILSEIPVGVDLRGSCAVGANCKIEPGAVLEDTVVWDDVRISSRTHLRRCVVCDKAQVDGRFADQVFVPPSGREPSEAN